MKKYNFIKEYKNGMKIERRNATKKWSINYMEGNGAGCLYFVWHNGSPIKCYGTEKHAVNYIETF